MAITKAQLDEYIKAYDHGKPLISDEEYDVLLEEYLQENGGESARPFNRQKQSSDVNDIVGTLPKAYGVTEPWRPGQKTYKKWLETVSNSHPAIELCKIMLQPKFDGCSVALDFTTGRFFTRGDYDNGESVDVTEVFRNHLEVVKAFARPGTTAMKFEAILSHEQFLHYALNLTYKRPRDVVSATITSRNVEMAQFITLVPLRGYVDGKQYIPNPLNNMCLYGDADAFSSIENYIKDRLAESATVKIFEQTFSIDGVVASVTDEPLGYVYPDLEVAIKILNDVKETKLRSIDYQFGKQGRITPVAIFDTVKFCDDKVNVDHATLSTLDRVRSMGLRHGDTVRIMYNIVPYLLESYHDGDYPIPLPTHCPICGAALDYNSGVIVRCKNPECKGLKLGAIIRHAEKMRMVGLGEGVLTKLYDNEFVTKIEDLYDLRKWDDCIAQTEGFGYTSYDNMVKSVDKALSEATLARFLGAMPFNDTDEKTWSIVIRELGEEQIIRTMLDGTFPDTILNAGYIPSVGKIKIRKIFDGYLRNKDEIQSLMSWIPEKLKPTTPWGSYAGRVCFTGFRDKELEKQLVDNGYEVGGFTNDLKALIVKDRDFQSDKVSRAKKLNIPIYTPDEVPDNLFQPF
ncbi:MAG: hypothetical protein J5614_08590 [Paludibacteraceae bacterium]|nr:hypothetical protein [Paludibacteraceae bacterium]